MHTQAILGCDKKKQRQLLPKNVHQIVENDAMMPVQSSSTSMNNLMKLTGDRLPRKNKTVAPCSLNCTTSHPTLPALLRSIINHSHLWLLNFTQLLQKNCHLSISVHFPLLVIQYSNRKPFWTSVYHGISSINKPYSIAK